MPDVFETTISAGGFNKLIQALKTTGMADTLKGVGPFTVFAPNDAAFDKLPAGTLEAWTEDFVKLINVVNYHIIIGNYTAAELKSNDVTSAETLQGANISIDTSDGVAVDGVKVIQGDIECSNGVIHVIDTVLEPK